MSWQAASGREVCNRCRKGIDLGAPVYTGEHTPSHWCEPCALEALGHTPEYQHVGPLRDTDSWLGLDKRKLAAAFPDFTESMRALKARATMKVTRRVVIGGDE